MACNEVLTPSPKLVTPSLKMFYPHPVLKHFTPHPPPVLKLFTPLSDWKQKT